MKPTDQELREFLALQRTIKIMEDRLNEIKNKCKETGSFSSDYYVCTVIPQTRKGLAPLEEVERKLGKDTLEAFNLVKISEFQVVKVAPLARENTG